MWEATKALEMCKKLELKVEALEERISKLEKGTIKVYKSGLENLKDPILK